MKKFFIATLLFATSFAFAGKGYKTDYSKTDSSYQVTFYLTDWNLEQIAIAENIYQKIDFHNAPVTLEKGWAELPFMSVSLQLPNQQNVTLRIVEVDYHDITLDFPLLPSRGVIYRNQDPKTVPYAIDSASLINEFYPSSISYIEEPFIIRDVRGTTIRTFPFQYKANAQQLRVFTKIKVELVKNNEPATNPFLRENPTPNKQEQGMYRSMFINYETPRASASLNVGEYGDMLVLTPPAFESTIDTYIRWKREKGFNVTKQVVTAGTNVSTIVQTAYDNNPNLMYVQLVGDWADIKSKQISSDGSYAPVDPELGCVSGDDDYPDISIGRFSCAGTADLLVQINKAINYEKNPNMDDGWHETFIGIASDEGPGDDNEYDYTHVQRIYTQRLANFTYQTHKENYDPNASSATLASHVNAGASTIAYCGHGSSSAFVTTYYGINQVNSSTNGNKLPFIVSVACVNGAFHGTNVCFAEAWLRKENGGAVLTWMSTINQPWDPPQRGQDYFYDILVGGFNYDNYPGQNGINTNEQRTHWGSITVNASNLMLMESSYSSDIATVFTWTTFGDASLQLRTKKPDQLLLSNNIIPAGAPFTGVASINGTPLENVLICISQNGNYYSGLTDANGNYSIQHDFIPDSVLIVATAFNTTTIYEYTTCTGAVCEGVIDLSGQGAPGEITLSWIAPANDSVGGYNVYRDGELVATTNQTSYYENDLLNGTYNYCVKVLYNGEECYVSSCINIEVDDGIDHECALASNLSGFTHSNQVSLQWTAPEPSNAIFEDVESHTNFAINSPGAIGWSYIDGDQRTTYRIADYSFTNQGEKMAYIVFNPSLVMPSTGSTPLSHGEGFTAHSGNKFFASFSASSGSNDDWIISPELNFSSEINFSFYARGGHKSQYVESFRVGYSTTGKNQNDFNIVETIASVPFEWTQYNYTIPADAKYVAIHCNSNNQYYFCVDDISIQETSPTVISHYKVYCDGHYVGSTTSTSFTHEEGTIGEHTYCVETYYSNGCISYPICTSVTITEITHTIMASASAGGTISPSGNVGVLDYGNKTFNITPNNGYRIKDVLVNQVSQGPITDYTFTNVTSDQTIFAEFESESSSIAENNGMLIKIYPNPIKNELFIEAEGAIRVSLINMLGQEVISEQGKDGKLCINTEKLYAGIYFVKLQIGEQIITRKIIKQ